MKVLFTASIEGHFTAFHLPYLQYFHDLGYEVHTAAKGEEKLPYTDVQHKVCFERSPLSKKNIQAYRELKKLISENEFDLIHCHTPVASVLTRLAARKARKKGTKVIYTAHGFHFYKGAPLVNWLLYYPAERLCAHFTDALITINHEDYARAKGFAAKRVYYVPGVGVDIQKFSSQDNILENAKEKRNELGVLPSEKMLLSVGELSTRKNHEFVIRALARVSDDTIKYFICGRGDLQEYLLKLSEELGIRERVQLLGFRSDIAQICQCADLFVFPSLQEGLPVALMEAIAAKVPVLCSDIRGNSDLVSEESLFSLHDIDALAEKIEQFLKRDTSDVVQKNYEHLKQFDITEVAKEMETLYTAEIKRGGGTSKLAIVLRSQLLKKSIGIPLGAFVILSVGEVNRNKNHRVILEAIHKLADETIYYIICGRGNQKETLENLAKEYGMENRLKMLGYQTNIAEWLSVSDVFAFPSVREGLGLAALEAMAAGLPLITSDSGGIKDYMQNGKTGFCCSYHDTDGFAKAIKKLKEDSALREKIGEENKIAVQKFDIENVKKIMKEIYEEV